VNLKDFHKALADLKAKFDRRERENQPDREGDTDPRIRESLERAMRANEELDPIVRETMRDNPAALAEWDEIMHMCDDVDEDRPDNAVDSSTP
jgi:hypothetical protein